MVIRGKKVYHIGTLFFVLIIAQFILINPTSATSHTLTLSSSGAQNINITAATNTVVSTDSISVATTCRYGYNLVSSTSVNDNNLYLNGDASNNTSGTFVSPSDGTTILSNATNTWGYYYNANSAVAPTASSVFSPVPALGNTATIKTPLTTPASADISDSFDIYYGVNSAPTMTKGAYKMIPDTNNSNNNGTIVYQATMADSCIKYTVHFNPTSTATGSSVSGTGTMNDQLIAEGIATQLNSNTFTAPNGYYFAGWNTAQDGSGTTYADTQSVTDLTTVGSTITLYAMWDTNPAPVACTAGNICYQPNASNAVGTMGDQELVKARDWSSCSDTDYETYCYDSNDNEVDISTLPELDYYNPTLYASNFSRAGYGFAGWSDAYDYATNPNANFYGPMQTITVPTGTTANGLSLYAVWIKSAGSLQSDATTACNGLTEDPNDGTADLSSVTALTDERDNNTYAIAKLADGKCWMIENLRLENTASHNTDGTLAQGYNSSFIGLADPESANFSYNSTTANSLYSTDGSTAAPAITGDYTGYRFPRYNNNNTNSRQSSSSYSKGGNTYSYGNYYTWHAAIADTTHYGTNNQSIENTSLCPTGWRLPKGGNKSNETNNEFWNLIVTGLNNGVNPANYNSSAYPEYTGTTEGTPISNTLRSYPNNFLYSGNFNGSSALSRGNIGFYWSSTVGGDNRNSYFMRLHNSGVYPGTYDLHKSNGIAIRCTLGS